MSARGRDRGGGSMRSNARAKLLKVVLLGDGGVGKSCLMNRFVTNKFDSQSFHTIGVEFLNKDVIVDDDSYTLQIWDTAGQERFKSLRTPFYRGADCCLLTYAVNDLQSFKNLSMWRKEFLYYADVQDGSKFPFIVLGNKVDVSGERQVLLEEAEAWCASNGEVPHYDTSAKDAINVHTAFEAAVRQISVMDARSEGRHSHTDTVDLKKKRQAQNGTCC